MTKRNMVAKKRIKRKGTRKGAAERNPVRGKEVPAGEGAAANGHS